ncbi:MAG: ATP-dependent sacrificial sulfur transferase LarE [Firmicutes bacterium]|nr:ATP-dependent sacrificial sulfur transferase LarE [Bacillota bacterium]
MLQSKLQLLENILQEMESALVAFSGGVDSTFLLHTAARLLEEHKLQKLLAVTIKASMCPDWELKEAEEYARSLGVEHVLVEFDIMGVPEFVANPPRRCYYCKRALFEQLLDLAAERGLKWVMDGSNKDDEGDYRPGREALKELGIRSPLWEAGLTKAEIREASRILGLPTWDKPSYACLASRIPYGVEITSDKLKLIDQAEGYLRELGFRQVRVRYHHELARIEVDKGDLKRLVDHSPQIVRRFEELGFLYVTADLAGYRTGSLNASL